MYVTDTDLLSKVRAADPIVSSSSNALPRTSNARLSIPATRTMSPTGSRAMCRIGRRLLVTFVGPSNVRQMVWPKLYTDSSRRNTSPAMTHSYLRDISRSYRKGFISLLPNISLSRASIITYMTGSVGMDTCRKFLSLHSIRYSGFIIGKLNSDHFAWTSSAY